MTIVSGNALQEGACKGTRQEDTWVARKTYILQRAHSAVFDFFENSLGLKKFYTHFSGVEFDTEGNERHYSPIKKGEIKFEYLAEVILENDYNVITSSDSPLLEDDAMYMKLIMERVEARRQERMARREASEKIKESRKAAAEAES